MEFQFLIVISAIICGTLLSGFVIWKIIDLIKTWITRNNGSYDEETIDRIAKAFIKQKKDTERRLQNIEAIITNDDSATPVASSSRQLKEPKMPATIEIEPRKSEPEQKNESTGNLNNMFHKKKTE